MEVWHSSVSYSVNLHNIDFFTDIEDMLQTIAFLNGKKWSSMLIKRTYFGNWLRDYSQAVDVGSLKGVNAATIRILVRHSHLTPVSTEIHSSSYTQ